MAPEDWQNSNDPFEMLLCLRGEVGKEDQKAPSAWKHTGCLYGGDSPHATPAQCQHFVDLCRRLWSERTGKPEGEYAGSIMYSIKAATNLLAAEDLASGLAWSAAFIVAEESIKVTCADVDEEERLAWGWGGGPPDPLWQKTLSETRASQASFVRRVFRYPGRQLSR